MANTTIKANIELDSNQFKSSAESARQSAEQLGQTADRIAEQLNNAVKAENANSTSLKKLKKEFNEQKAIIQDCAVKMHALGDEAKNTEGYKKLQQQMDAARQKALRMKEGLDRAKQSIQDLGNKSNTEIKLDSIIGSLGKSTNMDISGLLGQFGPLGTVISNIDRTITTAMKNAQMFNSALNTAGKSAQVAGNQVGAAAPKVASFGSAASSAKGMLGGLTSSISSFISSLSPMAIGIAAGVAALAAFAVVAKDAVSASAEFEQSVANLSALTGQTGHNLENLQSRIRTVANDMTVLGSDVAKNFELIAGAMPELLENAAGLEKVSRSAVLMSKASGMELADATTALTTALKQFGYQAENASYAVDVLANAQKYGSATIQQLSESLAVCGTAASKAGVDLKTTSAALELLASKAIRGADAGTAFRNILNIMNTAGIDEINPRIVGLANALKELKKYNNVQMKSLFGQRGVTAASVLADNAENLEQLVGKLEEFGAASQQAQTRGATLNGSIKALNVTWKNFLQSFDTGSNFGKVFLSGPLQGVRSLISALSELVHAFDSLFQINLDDALDVSPIRDIINMIADAIKFVAALIKNLFDLCQSGKQTGSILGAAFTAISFAAKAVGEVFQWLTWAVNQIGEAAGKLRARLVDAFRKVPGVEWLYNRIKDLRAWILKLIQAYKDLKKELGVGSSKKDEDKPVKPEEVKPEDVWEQPYAKGSLADLEAQLQKLEKNHKEGLVIMSAEEYKREHKRLENLIAQKKKALGIEDKSTKTSTKKTEPKEGSVEYLEKKRTELETSIKNGTLKINPEDARKKLDELDAKIRAKKIEVGLIIPDSLNDLEQRLSDLQSKYKNGTIKLTGDEYTSQVKQLEEEIERKKIILKIIPDDESIEGIERQIDKIENDLKKGKLEISTEDAYRKIDELTDSLRTRQIELKIIPGENTGDYLQKKLDDFKNRYILGLTPEIDAEEYKRRVQEAERQIKSANITLGIDLDRDEADKKFNDLLRDFQKRRAGSSFQIATNTQNTVENATNNRERLSAIEAEMNMNDSLIEQLRTLAELYEKMGEAGKEGYDAVNQKIVEMNEKQAQLGQQASGLETEEQKTQKLTRRMSAASDAVGNLGSAFSNLGSTFKSPELDVAGIIAGAIANVIQGASAAIAQSSELGPFGWIAFSALIAAQMASVIGQIHQLSAGSYASGGIIQGSSAHGSLVGDRLIAHVNRGEAILNSNQQQRLWKIISGENSLLTSTGNNYGQIDWVLRGTDLYGSLRNLGKIKEKTGHQIGIH